MTNILRKETNYFTVDDGSEDGLDVEETKYYSSDSYDDNLDLIGYNSDLRDSKTGRLVAIVDFNEDDDEGRVRFCPHCESYGFHHKLGVLIVKKGEKRPADWESWLQCHECGHKYGRFDTIAQKTLKMNTEKHEESNPFNAKESIIMSTPRRNSREGKRISERKKREKNRAHDSDPEIDREIREHGEENVHVVFDSDP